MLEAENDRDLPEEDHQRDEEGARVHIVIERQRPDVAVHSRHHLRMGVTANISKHMSSCHTFFVKMEKSETKREARTPYTVPDREKLPAWSS